MNVKITPSGIFKALTVIIVILVILDVVAMFVKYNFTSHYLLYPIRLVDLDAEINIPTFFSAVTLLIASLLLFYIAQVNRAVRKDYLAWLVLALTFLYLSLDEAAMIHEMLIGIFKRSPTNPGLFYNTWVIPYGIALIIGGVLYIPFLIRLPRRSLILFVVSGIIYVSGAMGVEMFEGKYESVFGTKNLIYDIYCAVEETMEMFGVALFIYALLDYISSTSESITITVRKKHRGD